MRFITSEATKKSGALCLNQRRAINERIVLQGFVLHRCYWAAVQEPHCAYSQRISLLLATSLHMSLFRRSRCLTRVCLSFVKARQPATR